jgi:hypothetical protein
MLKEQPSQIKNYHQEEIKKFVKEKIATQDLSRVVEKIPNSSWKKVNIQNWLKSKQIVFDKTFVKGELLQLVKIHNL